MNRNRLPRTRGDGSMLDYAREHYQSPLFVTQSLPSVEHTRFKPGRTAPDVEPHVRRLRAQWAMKRMNPARLVCSTEGSGFFFRSHTTRRPS